MHEQCCGAGAARSRIILVEPESQRDTASAPALTATAPKLMWTVKNITNYNILFFCHLISYQFK
jgi:hypothetical protein